MPEKDVKPNTDRDETVAAVPDPPEEENALVAEPAPNDAEIAKLTAEMEDLR